MTVHHLESQSLFLIHGDTGSGTLILDTCLVNLYSNYLLGNAFSWYVSLKILYMYLGPCEEIAPFINKASNPQKIHNTLEVTWELYLKFYKFNN